MAMADTRGIYARELDVAETTIRIEIEEFSALA